MAGRRLVGKQPDPAPIAAAAADDALPLVAVDAAGAETMPAGAAIMPAKRPRPKCKGALTAGYTFAAYTVAGAKYASMEAALEALGTRKRCTGHAARIAKRAPGGWTILSFCLFTKIQQFILQNQPFENRAIYAPGGWKFLSFLSFDKIPAQRNLF